MTNQEIGHMKSTLERIGRLICCLTIALLAAVSVANAQLTTLYNFKGTPDGWAPIAGVARDAKGNLYGTTDDGGANGVGCVFKLAPDGTESLLYGFTPTGLDGHNPYAGLVRDKKGNLYGATLYGQYNISYGTIFKADSKGNYSVLYSFTGGADGADPYGENLILDPAGNLYGTGYSGGTAELGVVFEITASGTEKVLHSFTGGTEGERPFAGVIRDKAGNLYGTTVDGGTGSCTSPYGNGCGTVYKLAPDGTLTTLWSFTGGNDGSYPHGALLLDKKGNLYGTTTSGGPANVGTVFEIVGGKPNAIKVLHPFTSGTDGASPYAGLAMDKLGNLYGTTEFGGAANQGTVFQIDSKYLTETILWTFSGPDGAQPTSQLIVDKVGSLYGTTSGGGASGAGTVFKLKP
jgi:uncharacterized repeat protein (TIGR03803 family)